eukprot:4575645-Amphidinium_carterae.1
MLHASCFMLHAGGPTETIYTLAKKRAGFQRGALGAELEAQPWHSLRLYQLKTKRLRIPPNRADSQTMMRSGRPPLGRPSLGRTLGHPVLGHRVWAVFLPSL